VGVFLCLQKVLWQQLCNNNRILQSLSGRQPILITGRLRIKNQTAAAHETSHQAGSERAHFMKQKHEISTKKKKKSFISWSFLPKIILHQIHIYIQTNSKTVYRVPHAGLRRAQIQLRTLQQRAAFLSASPPSDNPAVSGCWRTSRSSAAGRHPSLPTTPTVRHRT
jgi:hypothetical protein